MYTRGEESCDTTQHPIQVIMFLISPRLGYRGYAGDEVYPKSLGSQKKKAAGKDLGALVFSPRRGRCSGRATTRTMLWTCHDEEHRRQISWPSFKRLRLVKTWGKRQW